MATYLALITWTDQGVQGARQTVERHQQARSAFESLGVRFQTVLWTTGPYDIAAIIEAPDDETVSVAVLQMAGQGNLRTQIARAFTEQEMQRIVSKLG